MDEVNGVDEVQEVNKVDVMDEMLEGGGGHIFSLP